MFFFMAWSAIMLLEMNTTNIAEDFQYSVTNLLMGDWHWQGTSCTFSPTVMWTAIEEAGGRESPKTAWLLYAGHFDDTPIIDSPWQIKHKYWARVAMRLLDQSRELQHSFVKQNTQKTAPTVKS